MTSPFPAAKQTDLAGANALSAERLSILLVNYNGARYLTACLESVLRFAPPDTQVILEDNASTDGSVELAEKEFPQLQIIRSSRNLGFAGGNNLAARSARGRFILLLNTDTLLLEPILPVVDWLESHSSCGALTINMLDGDRVPRACTGRFPSAARLALLRSMLVSPESLGAEEAYDVDWVQGSFLLIRSNVWQALNGLDERYFMYAEDVDLCKRVWDSGFTCAFLPRWRYLHWGGFNPSRFPDQVRGLATYIDLHMQAPRWVLCRAVLLIGCFMRAVIYRTKGVFSGREVDRTKAEASWRAFGALLQRRT